MPHKHAHEREIRWPLLGQVHRGPEVGISDLKFFFNLLILERGRSREGSGTPGYVSFSCILRLIHARVLTGIELTAFVYRDDALTH